MLIRNRNTNLPIEQTRQILDFSEHPKSFSILKTSNWNRGSRLNSLQDKSIIVYVIWSI